MQQIEIVNGALTRRTGDRARPILLLLHCFGDTGRSYARLMAHPLLQNYHLVAPDLWGFGASPRGTRPCTVDETSAALIDFIETAFPNRMIGVVGHSIMAAMAVAVAHQTPTRVAGVFSIEGCLLPEDVFYPGKAAAYEDPERFKADFLDEIWELGRTKLALRHFHAGVSVADPVALWELGRDAHRLGTERRLSNPYMTLTRPNLYYWSNATTPAATQALITRSKLPNHRYDGPSHWPMVDTVEETAVVLKDFFDGCFA